MDNVVPSTSNKKTELSKLLEPLCRNVEDFCAKKSNESKINDSSQLSASGSRDNLIAAVNHTFNRINEILYIDNSNINVTQLEMVSILHDVRTAILAIIDNPDPDIVEKHKDLLGLTYVKYQDEDDKTPTLGSISFHYDHISDSIWKECLSIKLAQFCTRHARLKIIDEEDNLVRVDFSQPN